MDIRSPAILKLKGGLFLLLALLSAGMLILPEFEFRRLILYGISVWAFCRTYYFCFYVLERYADPSFRYSGLLSILGYLFRNRGKRAE